MYKGTEGMWAWILHRVTGVGVFIFLLIHIIDTSLLWWPKVYDRIVSLYHLPFFRVMEVGLFACLVFHSLNGLRITIIDFWPQTTVYHKKMFYGVLVIFTVVMLVSGWVMIKPLLGGA